MDPLILVGIILLVIGLAVVGVVILQARLANHRRQQMVGEEETVIPVNLASVNDAVIVAQLGGQVTFVNERTRKWFSMDSGDPDLWVLAQRVDPPEAFLELFAAEGQASFSVGDMRLEASSHQVAVGNTPQFVVVLRQEASLPSLDKDERGSGQALRVISEVSRSLNATLDFSETLDASIDGINRLLQPDSIQVCLWNQESEHLRPVVRSGPETFVASTQSPDQEVHRDHGFTGWVARKRLPLLIRNVLAQDEIEYSPRITDPTIGSYIGVPLTVRNRFIGTLEITQPRPNQFDEDDKSLLVLIAEQIALAIDNARRYSDQTERIEELAGLQKIAEAMSMLQDPYQLYAQLGQRVAELMDTETGGVMLYDRDNERLVSQVPIHGVSDELAADFIIPLERGGQARSLWEDTFFWMSNNLVEEPIVTDLGLGWLAEFTGTNALAMAMMRLGDESIGLLHVSNKNNGEPFTLDDIRLLQLYADQAAILVESARLYSQEQSRVAELRGLQQISQTLSSLTNPDELYRQLTQRIAELMGVYICGVLLHDPETDMLTARQPFFGMGDDLTKDYDINVGKRGLARDVWREYDMFVSNSVTVDEYIDQIGIRTVMREANISNVMFAPLIAGGRRFGLLQVANKENGRDFDDSDQRLVAIFAGQAATLIDNARLYQDTDQTLRRRADELRSVSRISREVNATLELERILEVIATEALKAEGAAYGNLVMFRWNDNETDIIPTMTFGAETSSDARILELAVARSGDAVVIDDFEKVPHFPSPRSGTRSALIVPIQFEGRVVGLIGLYGTSTSALGPDAAEFVQALSSQATIAVTNATRYKEQVERSDLLRQRAEQLTQIFELSRAFRSDQSVEGNLASVAKAIQDTVGFNKVLVSVLEEDTKTLHPVAHAGFSPAVFDTISERHADYALAEQFIDIPYRLSESYMVPHTESLALYAALGLTATADDQQDQPASGKPGEWTPGTLLLVPLRSSEQDIIGLLTIDHPDDGMIPTRNTVELLEIFANQAAITVENSRLYRSAAERAEELSNSLSDLEQRNEELNALSAQLISKEAELSQVNELLDLRAKRLLATHRVMESINTTQTPDDVLRQIAFAMVQEMDIDQCIIALGATGDENGNLRVVAMEGRFPEDMEQSSILDGDDPISTAYNQRDAVLVKPGRSRTAAGARLAEIVGTQTMFALPMQFSSGQRGVLAVGSTRPGAAFGDEDKDLFQLLTSQIVVEYENATLYQKVQREAANTSSERDRLQQLHVITTALQQAESLQNRLTVIARGIRSVGWGRVVVALLDDDMRVYNLATAGYEAVDPKSTSVRESLISGDVWKRRFEDQEFNSLRVGASYYLPHDHPWVRKNIYNQPASNGSSSNGISHNGTTWHPQDQLYIPMYSGTNIVGIIALRDPIDGQRPTEVTLRPLELFVQQASSAIENIRLYQETLELQSYNEAVVQSIQQGIVVLDRDADVETFNAFVREEYNWTDIATGRNLFGLVPSLLEIKLDKDFNQVVKEGSPVERTQVNVQLNVRAEDDQPDNTVNIALYPRFDEAGTSTGVVMLIEDISSTLQLEADIALRGQQLASLSDISRNITSTLSFNQIIESIRKQASDVVAYDQLSVWLYEFQNNNFTLVDTDGVEKDTVKDTCLLTHSDNLRESILSTQEPVYIPDVHADERGPQGYANRSWLGVPMVAGGSMIGAMLFEQKRPGAYAPADVKVAEAYANQVGVALENARLFEEVTESATELARRTQRLSTLNRISATIGRSLDQNSILQTALDELVSAMDAPQGSVVLFDREAQRGQLVALHPSNPDGSVIDLTINLSDNPPLDLLQSRRQPVTMHHIVGNEDYNAMASLFEARSVDSVLMSPIMVGNNVIGMLAVEHTDASREFSDEQIEIAETITNQAATALQNARLYSETVSRQRELGILFEASQTASSSLDLETVVNSAARYFTRAMNMDGCMISIWNRADDELRALIDFDAKDGRKTLTAEDHRRVLRSFPATYSVLAERGALVINVSNTDLSERERDWLKQKKVGTALMLPLVTRDEAIGLVELWSKEEVNRISQSNIRIGRALAASVATSMQNASLHVETQSRLNELATINEISRALTGAISVEDLMRTIAQQVAEIFGNPSVTVAQYDSSTNQISFPLAIRDGIRSHLSPVEATDSLYKYIIDDRDPVLLSSNVEDWLENIELEAFDKLKSICAVPLIAGEKVVGVLSLEDYDAEERFTRSDLRVLSPIAAQVGVSLENTRLYSELEQRLSETTTLQEISRLVSSALDLEEIFQRVVKELAEAFNYPLITLHALEGRMLNLKASSGYTDEEIDAAKLREVELERGVIGRAIRSGKGQLVPDVSQDDDFIRIKKWTRNMLAVPVESEGIVLGVLAVKSGDERPITQNDVSLMQTFAGQVATAMVNASIYTQMVQFSEELEHRVNERTEELRSERDRIDTLYRITVELTASLDLDRVLQRALELVGAAIGAEHGSLFLIDPQSPRLIFRAAMSDYEIIPPGGKQIELTRHQGIAGWVMDNRQSVLIDDVRDDKRWDTVPGTENRRSMIGAPLTSGNEVLGCLFFNSDAVAQFNEGHLQLVEAAANQVATSINNAELYRMISSQAERLGTMLRSQQTEAAKSQAILESVADGVMVSDQMGEIILFNAAAERILDLRRSEVLGRPSTDLIGLYGAGAANWADMLEEWEADPVQYSGRFFSDRIEVGSKIVSVRVSPAVNNNEYLGLVSVFRDITAEVVADRVKSEFVARVSHELRTPMTSIKGYADLMLMGAGGELSEEHRNYLDTIRTNADRLSSLVNDLLDISKIEQDGMQLDIRRMEVGDVIADILYSLDGRMAAEEREIDLFVEMDEDLPMIEADEERLTQILANLVDNAYQYTDDGGSITIRAEAVDDGVQIDVEDTGIGIPSKYQATIFDRFVRAEEQSRVFQTAGTGLGLSIVKNLVEMHHGRIWFESEEDKGTTFHIWIPELYTTGRQR